jgi:hypothetical protein
MLADTLKDQFNDLANRSFHYWQGLAEHTALRIREFGRLQGYKKAKAILSHSGLVPESIFSSLMTAPVTSAGLGCPRQGISLKRCH